MKFIQIFNFDIIENPIVLILKGQIFDFSAVEKK